MENTIKTYMFTVGNHDGLSIHLPSVRPEFVQLPNGVTAKDNYIRETLAIGDVFISIYLHESLTSEQVLDLAV